MTTKEIALKTIEQLPKDATWEDIQERINFVAGIRKGLRELDEGKGMPHDKVKEEFAEWLTSQSGIRCQVKKTLINTD
jgi:predicted transcriptional regulator